MNAQTCIFCQIVGGQAKGHFVYEDERVVAFLDIDQAAPGHLLIVPRAHATYWWELSAEDAARIGVVARPLMLALRHAMGAEGVRLLQTNGRAAGQEVFHVHMHLIPRWKNKAPSKAHLSDPEMAARAAELQQALASLNTQP